MRLPRAAGTPSKWRSTEAIPCANLARQADKDHNNNMNAPMQGDLKLTLWSSLLTVRLHRDMRVQVVQGAVGLFASVPAAFVHALDFLVSPARTLVLLRAWNWDKRVDGRQRMSSL